MRNEVEDFLHFCPVERRLAPLTCSAYERDVRAASGGSGAGSPIVRPK